jgi:ATP synthase protein I
MAGPASDPGREQSDRDDQSIKRRLDALEGRLKALQGEGAGPEPRGRGSALGQALRMATEMVAAVGVGGFIGWALDSWLGSAPWLMVIFLLLGMTAGIMNVVRTAKAMQEGVPLGEDLPADDDEDD